ncbi:ABC transporter ATP-binding protein [Metabacillus litoralis]|uniref:ABC transporter ATP-binding protein n=1 Tax=Metabacillus litoralis TaxID=152268 RepID=UPI00203F88C6|nr:ABC transporter ATP-binding protein [Metabacillus litoralis]
MILEATNLVKKYKGLTAVDSYSVNIEEGEIRGLIGPNGAGKTTTFNLLTSMVPITEGNIRFLDKDITNKRPDQIAMLGISRTFQNIRLFKELTVLENVMIAAQIKKKYSFFESLMSLPKFIKEEKEIKKQAENLLEKVGLIDLLDYKAKNLSYGNQRKLEIARALAVEPKLLLLDEPAAGMNPNETIELSTMIRELKKELNLSILLIEHDVRFVMELCDKIQVLNYGKLIAEGTPKEIRENPEVIRAYLGRSTENA